MTPPDSPTPPDTEARTPVTTAEPGRRSFLLGGTATVLGVAGIGAAVGLSGLGAAGAAQRVTAGAAAPAVTGGRAATSRPSVPHRPAPHPSAPVWTHRWHAPIDSVNDFTHRSHAPAYARRAIMLTVDDGPSPQWTPRYLRLFAKYGITATFCMIGSQIGANKALVRDVVAHGHVVANHTWTHDEQLEQRAGSRIRSEIERTSHAIHAASGFVPSQFRAPGGGWGPAIFEELARQRLMPLGWDVDPRDWALPGTPAIERAMLAARPRNIILCHDGGGDRSQTYHALQAVIPDLLHRGYRFVTLPAPQPQR